MEVNEAFFSPIPISENERLKAIRICMPKNQSHFVYFVLEASEGLCFYSTLTECWKGENYREVEIFAPIERWPELKKTLQLLGPLLESFEPR